MLEFPCYRTMSVKHRNTFDISQKFYFGRLHLWSHSFSHNRRFMTMGKDGTNIDSNTESFAFLHSSHFKTTEWSKARTTALALPDRTFNSSSCLPSLVNATQDTWTSLPALMILHQLAENIGRGFSKDVVPQFWKCWFSFQQCHMHLQSHLMQVGGQIPRKPAKLNYLQKATD